MVFEKILTQDANIIDEEHRSDFEQFIKNTRKTLRMNDIWRYPYDFNREFGEYAILQSISARKITFFYQEKGFTLDTFFKDGKLTFVFYNHENVNFLHDEDIDEKLRRISCWCKDVIVEISEKKFTLDKEPVKKIFFVYRLWYLCNQDGNLILLNADIRNNFRGYLCAINQSYDELEKKFLEDEIYCGKKKLTERDIRDLEDYERLMRKYEMFRFDDESVLVDIFHGIFNRRVLRHILGISAFALMGFIYYYIFYFLFLIIKNGLQS